MKSPANVPFSSRRTSLYVACAVYIITKFWSVLAKAQKLSISHPNILDCPFDVTNIKHMLKGWLNCLERASPCRNKKAVFPHARAMAALVQAFAATDLDQAMRLYGELQKDSVGVAAVTLSNRYMWQSLIEAACRMGRMDIALKVPFLLQKSILYVNPILYINFHPAFKDWWHILITQVLAIFALAFSAQF